MNALDYLLKANLYGLLFVSCYWFFLRRHTFFNLNRFYLLTSAVLSLVLPLASLPAQTVETIPTDWPVPVGVISLPVATIATAPAQISQAGTAPDWEVIALFTYGLIAILLVLRLAIRVGRLCWLIHRSRQQVFADHVLVEAPNVTGTSVDTPTFSFFHYLVINPVDAHNELIIRHELVHIRQYHSADVLGLGLLRALFWVCPALWFIDRMLRQVHEFLADKVASQPTEYARFLLDYAFGLQPDTLTNGFFNPSLLKQRIQMLCQTATPRWALGKYALILPLLLSLLAMTTAKEEVVSVVDQMQDKTVTVTGSVTSSVDGKPLPGVSIIVKNIEKGTYTDSQGKFTIPKVSTSASLQFSFTGFLPQDVPVNGHTAIAVSLAPRPTNSKRKADNKRTGQASSPSINSSTGVIAEVQDKSKNARFALYSDGNANSKERYELPLPDSLKPSRPTVTIWANGFDVGGDPLYIIDGVHASKEKLDKLDPDSIVSIDVQKGSAATALHGEKARYGVVNVTTKRK